MAFKYNGKVWDPKNPEKKLKQLGITWEDVEVIPDEPKIEKPIELTNPPCFIFINPQTGESIESIYDNLNNLNFIKNINEYEYIGPKNYS